MKRNEYWIKRVSQEQAKMGKLTERETAKLLRKLYKEQSESFVHNIEKVFAKMEDDLQKQGKTFINDAYRTVRYHDFLTDFNRRAQELGAEQVIITRKSLVKTVQESQAIIQRFAPKSALKVIYSVPQAIRAQDIIRVAWAGDGMNFSDRIWKDKELLVKTLYKGLTDGMVKGETPYKIASELEKRFDVSLNNAMRLARTEMAHAQTVATTTKYKQMGFRNGIWLANDGCEECAALDGQVFPLEELEHMLPAHPNCRCSFLLEVD